MDGDGRHRAHVAVTRPRQWSRPDPRETRLHFRNSGADSSSCATTRASNRGPHAQEDVQKQLLWRVNPCEPWCYFVSGAIALS